MSENDFTSVTAYNGRNVINPSGFTNMPRSSAGRIAIGTSSRADFAMYENVLAIYGNIELLFANKLFHLYYNIKSNKKQGKKLDFCGN